MTNYYAAPGGNDNKDGKTIATRWATIPREDPPAIGASLRFAVSDVTVPHEPEEYDSENAFIDDFVPPFRERLLSGLEMELRYLRLRLYRWWHKVPDETRRLGPGDTLHLGPGKYRDFISLGD